MLRLCSVLATEATAEELPQTTLCLAFRDVAMVEMRRLLFSMKNESLFETTAFVQTNIFLLAYLQQIYNHIDA